jgi:hypothetical protein
VVTNSPSSTAAASQKGSQSEMAEKILASASMGVMNSLLGKLTALMGGKYAKLKDVRKQVPIVT